MSLPMPLIAASRIHSGVVATATPFGTPDGVTSAFQLADKYGFPIRANANATAMHRTDWQGRQALAATARTNYLSDSCSFAGVMWENQSNYTTAPAVALVPSHTAYKWTDRGGGSKSLGQNTAANGNYSGNPETMSLIIENVNATVTTVGCAQGGAGPVWVFLGKYTWADDTFVDSAGSGGTFTVTQLGAGPNGGKMVKLSASNATAGLTAQQRQLYLYLSGVPTNTNTTIPHAAQHEVNGVATSIIVNDTSAALTVTDYTYTASGVATMGQIPVASAVLDWDGSGLSVG